MLQNILIRDFAIVPQEELEFSPGFTVITGETGAGKSLLVDALGLLSGRRADINMIRHEAEKAELVAEFELDDKHPAYQWLSQAEMDDGSHCLLRRVISRSGRSRAWINGTPVTLNQLQDLGSFLVEIHGQNEHIRLNQREERFQLLDGGGDYSDLLEQVSEHHAQWHAANAELNRLKETAPLDPAEIELLTHQLQELEAAAQSPEQIEKLEQEQRRLSRGHEYSAALEFGETAMSRGQDQSDGIIGQLHQVISGLKQVSEDDERISEIAAMLQEALINCEEAQQNIQRIVSEVDLSPERLQAVEGQLSHLHDLARKHRVALEELPQALADLEQRIETSRSLETRIQECEASEKLALDQYRTSAQSLSDRRKQRALELSEEITTVMQELAMQGGCFEIRLEHLADSEPTSRGSDQVSLLVSGTSGAAPGPLGKVASGGELSRISLAVRVANYRLRDFSNSSANTTPIQIFDEVDAGVGGDTANSVGEMLRTVADSAQTLCVTHLAQVAARAHQQVKIEKSSDEKAIKVNAVTLSSLAREEEIARMLSGTVSENSLAHARELIKDSAA